jgi:hypothetical protein
MGDTL